MGAEDELIRGRMAQSKALGILSPYLRGWVRRVDAHSLADV